MIRIMIGCLFIGTATVCQAAQPQEFKFHKEIERGDAQMESIAELAIDSDVYDAARNGFADLRIFDSEGQETPFLLEKATESLSHVVRVNCINRVISLNEQTESLEIVLQLDEKSLPADGLAVGTPLSNYEHRVQVLGSRDGKEWKPLVNDGIIFDYSRYMDIRNREVRLPQNDARQLKVIISGIADTKESPFSELTRKYQNGGESERVEKTSLERRPFRIDHIELWSDKNEVASKQEKKLSYPPKAFHIEENAQEKTTTIYIDTRHEPLTEISLETSSRNFNRDVAVQAMASRGNQQQWLPIASGSISLLDFGRFHRESLSLAIPEQRQSQYRIVIHNQDNPPLKITGVQAKGNAYRIIFLAAENKTYQLYYGSDQVEPAKYDVAAVLAPLRLQGDPPKVFHLGKPSAPAVVEPRANNLLQQINDPGLLGGVVVLLVAVLGWTLFRAMRRINTIPKDEESQPYTKNSK